MCSESSIGRMDVRPSIRARDPSLTSERSPSVRCAASHPVDVDVRSSIRARDPSLTSERSPSVRCAASHPVDGWMCVPV